MPGSRRANRIWLLSILPGLVTLSLLATACGGQQAPADEINNLDMANPASVYCLEQGYQHEIQTAEDGSQSGWCIFPDNSNCEEWAFFRGECGPGAQSDKAAEPAAESDPNTSPPPSSADYQGWWTYLHPAYNFSLLLPEDWVAEEITSKDTPPSGHMINLHPRYTTVGENIQVTFRQAGEDLPLWPTGVGQGEFIQQGTLDISGDPVLRYLLVCPTGEITSIWYHQAEDNPVIRRGDIEFAFIFRASNDHCQPGTTLDEKIQRYGELIISSLSSP